MPPQEIVDAVNDALEISWESDGNLFIDASLCEECQNHWNIIVCPKVREIMGGSEDGREVFPGFVLNINKMRRVFDKTPQIRFDNTEDFVHVIFTGRIRGHKCDLVFLSRPPLGLMPAERAYSEGPRKGEIENIEDEDP